MNSNSNKSILSIRNTNKENCIVIDDYDEIFNSSPAKQAMNENSRMNFHDDESSLGFLSMNSRKKGLSNSKSLQEPRLKGVKLSQSPARSNADSGINNKFFQE